MVLKDTFGNGHDFEMLAYIGPNDIKYIALILGAARTGYVVWYSSTDSRPMKC